MKTSDVLYKAATVMRERGRCPDDFTDHNGRVCIWGAINVVINRTAWDWHKTDKYTNHFSGVVGTGVADFSNRHCKTADDAIAALEIAADIAHAEGK